MDSLSFSLPWQMLRCSPCSSRSWRNRRCKSLATPLAAALRDTPLCIVAHQKIRLQCIPSASYDKGQDCGGVAVHSKMELGEAYVSLLLRFLE